MYDLSPRLACSCSAVVHPATPEVLAAEKPLQDSVVEVAGHRVCQDMDGKGGPIEEELDTSCCKGMELPRIRHQHPPHAVRLPLQRWSGRHDNAIMSSVTHCAESVEWPCSIQTSYQAVRAITRVMRGDLAQRMEDAPLVVGLQLPLVQNLRSAAQVGSMPDLAIPSTVSLFLRCGVLTAALLVAGGSEVQDAHTSRA